LLFRLVLAELGPTRWNRFGRNLREKARFGQIQVCGYGPQMASRYLKIQYQSPKYADTFTLVIFGGQNYVQKFRVKLMRKVFGRNGVLWNRSLAVEALGCCKQAFKSIFKYF
jgi:hypothetical protein